MLEDVGVEVKFAGLMQGGTENALEFIHVHVIVLDEENQII